MLPALPHGESGTRLQEKRLRITLVYDLMHPFTIGGAERRFYEIGRRLARRHDVHFVSLKHWSGDATIRTPEGYTLHGVPNFPAAQYGQDGRRNPLQPLWFGAMLLCSPRLFRADIIDCSSFPFFSMFSSRAHASLAGIPLIGTWHEFWGDYWSSYAGRLGLVGRSIERLAVRSPSRIVSVSELTRRGIEGAGLGPGRITVVPNGVDSSELESRVDPNPAPDLVFVGRLIEEKGAHILIEAMTREPLGRLMAGCVIVGQGPEEGRLRAMASRLGLTERVRFISRLEQAELNGLMASARVLVLPSSREGFGMVVIEAMALGTPVVVTTSPQSAAPDLVSHGTDGLVAERTPEAVARAVETILTSPALRARMGEAARKKAALYDWNAITDRMEGVYVEAIRTHGRPRRSRREAD